MNSASLVSSQVEPFSRQAVNSITGERKSRKGEWLCDYFYFQSAVAGLYLAKLDLPLFRHEREALRESKDSGRRQIQ